MVKIHEQVYLDKDTREKFNKIKKTINKNKILLDVYVITLSSNPNEQLDIFSYPMFQLEKKQRDDIMVVGISHGKKSALELVKDMSLDAKKRFDRCDLRALFT